VAVCPTRAVAIEPVGLVGGVGAAGVVVGVGVATATDEMAVAAGVADGGDVAGEAHPASRTTSVRSTTACLIGERKTIVVLLRDTHTLVACRSRQ
jgi:hypothetical protein